MKILDYSPAVEQMKEKIRQHTRRTSPFASQFYEMKRELRTRRKLFLGSDVPLADLVKVNGVIDDKLVTELSHYLTEQSLHFCAVQDYDRSRVFERFYSMSIYAFCEGVHGDGCLDDIIFSAECLARSKDSFVEYMKTMLPQELVGEMFAFTDLYADFLGSALFPEIVLGAVCVVLGVIKEPCFIPKQTITMSKEAIARARSRAKK